MAEGIELVQQVCREIGTLLRLAGEDMEQLAEDLPGMKVGEVLARAQSVADQTNRALEGLAQF